MILPVIIGVSLLIAINYKLGGKFLYPPVVFCSTWAVELVLVRLADDFFYPVSHRTLMIFLIGCVVFSGGSLLALLIPEKMQLPTYDLKASNRIITVLLITLIVSLPFIYRWISSLAEDFASSNFLLSVHMGWNAAFDENSQPVLIVNLMTLSSVLALICVCECASHRKRAVLVCLMGLAILVMTGARSGIVIMILAIVGIYWMRAGRLRLKFLAWMAVALLIVISALAIFLHKGEATEEISVSENLSPVVEGIVLYAAGGLPGFSQVVENPTIIEHNWQVQTYLLSQANRFGAHYRIPPINAEFVTVGPGRLPQNVYTMYFAYFDWGYVGMMCLVAFLGFVVTTTYKRAQRGHKIALLLYGYFFAGMILSPYSDYFFMGMSGIVKVFEVSWLVFSLPVRWRQLWYPLRSPAVSRLPGMNG